MTSPNPFHYAVVVGITTYPGGYKRLNGPVNDAKSFTEWLKDTDQGGLPDGNVWIVITPTPEPADIENATPTKQLIDRALSKAHKKLEEDLTGLPEDQRPDARASSRIYLFVAGHGIMPGGGTAALLDATAEPDIPTNLEISLYVKWMARKGAFAEVVAVADCCRTDETLAVPGQPFFRVAERLGQQVRQLTALATTAGDLSYEDTSDELALDDRRGHFSKTLIKGLRGNAADPATGLVTTKGLQSYVEPILTELTKDKQVPQKAEFHGDEIVFGAKRAGIVTAAAPGRERRKVVIHFPDGFALPVELVSPSGEVMAWDPKDGAWTVWMYDGLWFVQHAGTDKVTDGLANDGLIEVQGAGFDAHL